MVATYHLPCEPLLPSVTQGHFFRHLPHCALLGGGDGSKDAAWCLSKLAHLDQVDETAAELPSCLTVRTDGRSIRVAGHVAEARGAAASVRIELTMPPSPAEAAYVPPVGVPASGGGAMGGGAVGGGAVGGGGVVAGGVAGDGTDIEVAGAGQAPSSPAVSPRGMRASRSTPPRVYDPRLPGTEPFAERRSQVTAPQHRRHALEPKRCPTTLPHNAACRLPTLASTLPVWHKRVWALPEGRTSPIWLAQSTLIWQLRHHGDGRGRGSGARTSGGGVAAAAKGRE